jgi:hypothetical protein
MCYKNAQAQNKPTVKWGTCYNGKYMRLLQKKIVALTS